MLMDTVGYFRIAIVRMLMAARRPCRPLGIAALVIVRRVVFTQAACGNAAACLPAFFGKGRCGQHCQHHAADQQDAEYSFFHVCSSLSPASSVRFVFFFLSRMQITVSVTPTTKAAMPTTMYAPASSRSSTEP